MPDPEMIANAYRRKPEFFEHRSAQYPDLVFVCPRCKTSLVFAPPNSIPSCYRCSNEEPGRVYIALDALLPVLAQAMAIADMFPVGTTVAEWVRGRAAEMGQPMQPVEPA